MGLFPPSVILFYTIPQSLSCHAAIKLLILPVAFSAFTKEGPLRAGSTGERPKKDQIMFSAVKKGNFATQVGLSGENSRQNWSVTIVPENTYLHSPRVTTVTSVALVQVKQPRTADQEAAELYRENLAFS